MNKNYKVNSGLKYGGAAVLLGLVLIIVNFLMIQYSGKYLVKATGFGFIAFFAGLAMLLAPGKQVIEDTSASKLSSQVEDIFSKSSILTKIIWIVYALCGIAACIFCIVSEYWEDVLLLFIATFAFTSVLFVIKYIYFFFTNAGEQKDSIDDDYDSKKTDSENLSDLEEIELLEKNNKFSFYYKPSKIICIIGMLIFSAAAFFSSVYFYDTKYAASDSYKVFRDKKFDHILVENLGKIVPVRFYDVNGKPQLIIYENDVNLWQKFTDDENFELGENDYLNLVKLPLSHIIRQLAQKPTEIDETNSNSKVCALKIVGIDDSVSDYSYRNIKRIPQIKEFLKNNAPEDFDYLIFNADNEKSTQFLKESFDKIRVFSIPCFKEEYIHIWDLASFIDFMSPYSEISSKTPQEIFDLFNSGYFDFSEFFIRDFDDFCDYIFNEQKNEYKNDGFILNYGTENCTFINHDEAAKIFNEYKNQE